MGNFFRSNTVPNRVIHTCENCKNYKVRLIVNEKDDLELKEHFNDYINKKFTPSDWCFRIDKNYIKLIFSDEILIPEFQAVFEKDIPKIFENNNEYFPTFILNDDNIIKDVKYLRKCSEIYISKL